MLFNQEHGNTCSRVEEGMDQNQPSHFSILKQDGNNQPSSPTSQKHGNALTHASSHRKHKHSHYSGSHHDHTSQKHTSSHSNNKHHHHHHHHQKYQQQQHRCHSNGKHGGYNKDSHHGIKHHKSHTENKNAKLASHRKTHRHLDRDSGRPNHKYCSGGLKDKKTLLSDNNNKDSSSTSIGKIDTSGENRQKRKRLRKDLDRTHSLPEKRSSDSGENSEIDLLDMKTRWRYLGNVPFTRTQKDQIYKIFGQPKPKTVTAKPMKISFDPTIFDNEKSSDSEGERDIELKSRSDVIVSEYLIPMKQCMETVDKIVKDIDSDEELPDLELAESACEFISVAKKQPAISLYRDSNFEDLEFIYPGLKLSPGCARMIKSHQTSLQPVVQIKKLDCISTTPPLKQQKIPRLVLKCESKHHSSIRKSFLTQDHSVRARNIFDSLQSTLSTDYEDSGNKHHSAWRCIESTDSSDEDTAEPPRKRRRGHKEVKVEAIPTVTTSILLDEYSQKYRYRAAKGLDHHWIPSQPIAESTLPEFSSPVASKVTPFFANMVHMIDCCHDEGNDFYLKVLQLVSSFSTSSMEAPMSVLRTVLFDILLTCEDAYKVQMAFNLLVDLLDRHPPRDEVPFDWNNLELVVSKLNLPRGISAMENRVVVLRKVLALKYMVCAMEKELLHRTVTQQKQVLKSVAYHWLSCEVAFPHVRSVIRWLIHCMSYGEYNDLEVNFLSMCISTAKPPPRTEESQEELLVIPKVFPIIEKLLDLSLTVSRQPLVCAERMANDLALEYNHLTNLTHKKFLLENLSHPLLVLRLASRVLSHCDTVDEVMIRTDVHSLYDIVKGHFLAKPPLNAFTPPATPGEDGEEEEKNEIVNKGVCNTQYPIEAVEELAMLLWFCVHSYLEVHKGKYTESLSRRSLDKKASVLSSADAEVLKNIKHHVNKLKRRLIQYCGSETSRNIKMYLMCLYSLESMDSSS